MRDLLECRVRQVERFARLYGRTQGFSITPLDANQTTPYLSSLGIPVNHTQGRTKHACLSIAKRRRRHRALVKIERPNPKPAYRQVLVKVMACSLNFRDLGIVRGTYRMPVRDNIVPLSDGAGEVVEVGAGVTRVKVGDKVAGCFFQRWSGGEPPPDVQASALGGSIDGMLAEYVVLEEEGVVKIPGAPVGRRGRDVALRRVDSLARPGRTRQAHCRPDRAAAGHRRRLDLRAATGACNGLAGRHHVIER